MYGLFPDIPGDQMNKVFKYIWLTDLPFQLIFCLFLSICNESKDQSVGETNEWKNAAYIIQQDSWSE